MRELQVLLNEPPFLTSQPRHWISNPRVGLRDQFAWLQKPCKKTRGIFCPPPRSAPKSLQQEGSSLFRVFGLGGSFPGQCTSVQTLGFFPQVGSPSSMPFIGTGPKARVSCLREGTRFPNKRQAVLLRSPSCSALKWREMLHARLGTEDCMWQYIPHVGCTSACCHLAAGRDISMLSEGTLKCSTTLEPLGCLNHMASNRP